MLGQAQLFRGMWYGARALGAGLDDQLSKVLLVSLGPLTLAHLSPLLPAMLTPCTKLIAHM